MVITIRLVVAFLFFGIAGVVIIDFFGSPVFHESVRTQHFNSADKIVEDLKPEEVASLLTTHYAFYKDKVSSLYSNMTVTLILGVVCIILLLREDDIEIPGFYSLKIPIKITYLIAPSALCYYWLQFGFLLHDCIGSRIELVRLIQAGLRFKGLSESYQNYFTYTALNTVKDTGFVDTWFLFYFPSLFRVSDIASSTKFLPMCTMVLVGLLYGISQGFALALPFNWRWRYGDVHIRYKLLVSMLFITILLLVLISHFTFYFGGRNPNWMQIPITLSAGATFLFLTWTRIRNFHSSTTAGKLQVVS